MTGAATCATTRAYLDGLDDERRDAILTDLAARYGDYSDDPAFSLWLYVVDRVMVRMVGVGFLDIADWTWRDAYEDGVRARDAVREALESDDTYSAVFG